MNTSGVDDSGRRLLQVIMLLADIPLIWGVAEYFAGPLLLSPEAMNKGAPLVLMIVGAMLQAPFATALVVQTVKGSKKDRG